MLTYAAGKELSEAQFLALKGEGDPEAGESIVMLISAFDQKTEESMEVLKNTPVDILPEFRSVGRKNLPSSVIGLFFHAAEHSQKHGGQMLVTIKVLKEKKNFV